jgi:hypothetical protein
LQVKSTLEAVIGKIKGVLNLENPYDLLEAAASLHEAVDEQLALGAAGAKLKTQVGAESLGCGCLVRPVPSSKRRWVLRV